MADIRGKAHEVYALESYAEADTPVGRLYPVVKILLTFIYILTVVSFSRYDFFALLPYVFYPVLMLALGDLPPSLVWKRSMIAVPFCLCAGIANIIYERTTVFVLLGVPISLGVLSLVTITYKAVLCVAAVLILVGTTPIYVLSAAFTTMHMPMMLTALFEMTYRYIGVLADEAGEMYDAYILRAGRARGIAMKDMGSFVGQLFLRSADRADRVYSAMKCRGWGADSGAFGAGQMGHMRTSDWLAFILITAAILIPRFANIPLLYMKLMGGLF